MTKITGQALDKLVKTGVPGVKAVLFYGQDAGLIEECRSRIVQAVVQDKDPFRIVELTPSRIKEDPSLLLTEANSFSLMGGRRVVVISGADNNFTVVLKEFFSLYKGDTLLVVTAGGLTKKDSLLSLFTNSSDLAVFGCYGDEGQALVRWVAQEIGNNGFQASSEVVCFIAENLGADRLQSRSELQKLFAYMGKKTNITMQDASACIGDASALSINQMLYALATGNQKKLHQTLDRLFSEGQLPIVLLRSASGHFKKLHQVLAKRQEGGNLEQILISLRLFYNKAEEFKEQLRLWDVKKTARALDLLVQAEQDCKIGSYPQKLVCARVFLQIAAQAQKR